MENISVKICQIVSKPYQNRSLLDHKHLVQFLSPYFIDLNSNKIKLMTFYLKRIQGEISINTNSFSPYSFVIKFQQNSLKPTLIRIDQKISVNLSGEQQCLVLDYKHYLNCEQLGNSSIEQQIQFLKSTQYFCSMPVKMYLQILRKSYVIKCDKNKVIFSENQDVTTNQSGSGVYIIRKGQYSYSKYSIREKREIQIIKFQQGHLFGSTDLSCTHRLFKAECKSSFGLLYHIEGDFFMKHLVKFCENIIKKKENKLLRFIPSKVLNRGKSILLNIKRIDNPEQTNISNIMNSKPVDNQIIKLNSSQSLKLSKYSNFNQQKSLLPTLLSINSEAMAEQFARNTTYLSLRKQGALKRCPLINQRISCINSQFRQTQYLMRSTSKKHQVKKQYGVNRGDFIFNIFANKKINQINKSIRELNE